MEFSANNEDLKDFIATQTHQKMLVVSEIYYKWLFMFTFLWFYFNKIKKTININKCFCYLEYCQGSMSIYLKKIQFVAFILCYVLFQWPENSKPIVMSIFPISKMIFDFYFISHFSLSLLKIFSIVHGGAFKRKWDWFYITTNINNNT